MPCVGCMSFAELNCGQTSMAIVRAQNATTFIEQLVVERLVNLTSNNSYCDQLGAQRFRIAI